MTLCAFLSLFMVIMQIRIRLIPLYFYLGIYLFLFSFIAIIILLSSKLIQHMNNMFAAISFLRMLSILPFLQVINQMDKKLMPRRNWQIVSVLLIILMVPALLLIFTDIDLIHFVSIGIIDYRTLVKTFIIPLSFLYYCYIGIRILISFISFKRITRKTMIFMFSLIIIPLFFVQFDLFSLLYLGVSGKKLFASFWGVILLFLFTLYFVIVNAKKSLSQNKNDQTVKLQKSNENDPAYQKILSVIKEKKLYQKPGISIEDVAKEIRMNREDLSRKINEASGMNFKELINRLRIEEMIRLLEDPQNSQNINEISREVGFRSNTSMHRSFHTFLKTTPKEYRKKFARESYFEFLWPENNSKE